MSDEYMGDASAELESGQISDSVQEDVQEGAKPQPVTLDILQKLLDERDEKLARKIQSLNDKQDDRVTKRLATWKEELKRFGVDATDEMVNSKRLEIATQEADRAIAEDDDAQSHSRQDVTKPDPQVIKQTTDAMLQISKELGGHILGAEDPEYWELKNAGLFDASKTSPQDFLRAYREKLVELHTRQGHPIPEQSTQTATNPATRTPAPTGTPYGGVESIVAELNTLQNKVARSYADNKRMKELEAELMKHVPKR